MLQSCNKKRFIHCISTRHTTERFSSLTPKEFTVHYESLWIWRLLFDVQYMKYPANICCES